jgi:antitoxin ParD1/3/4
MHVSLTPKLEDLVREKVESGLYNNASEVIREALRLMHDFDAVQQLKLERLREALRVGDEDLAAGRSISISSDAELDELFARL